MFFLFFFSVSKWVKLFYLFVLGENLEISFRVGGGDDDVDDDDGDDNDDCDDGDDDDDCYNDGDVHGESVGVMMTLVIMIMLMSDDFRHGLAVEV